MSTENQIRANYNSANATADELESIASSLSRLANSDMEEAMSALGAAWQGENAERFLQKGDTVKEQILGTAKKIRTAASELRSDARATYNTEMKNLQIAKEKAEKIRQQAMEAAREAAREAVGGLLTGRTNSENIKDTGKSYSSGGGRSSEGGGAGTFGGGGGGSW